VTTYRIRAEGELEASGDAAAETAISEIARLLADNAVGRDWRVAVNRMPDTAEGWDTTELRRVSSVERDTAIPWTSLKSPMILVAGREIVFATDALGKRELVRRAGEGVLMFVWEGTWRSDVFVVDDPERAAEALHGDAETLAGL
jgi:hypothetical protein